MKTNQTGLELIKKFEGFSSTPYICPAGYWTIGYGHRINYNEDIHGSMDIFKKQGVLQSYAEDLLKQDLISAERAVNKLITSTLNENQFSALVSFVFNLGSGRLQSSTLRMKLNRGDYEGAADELLKWTKGGGRTLKGLVARRTEERRLFLS